MKTPVSLPMLSTVTLVAYVWSLLEVWTVHTCVPSLTARLLGGVSLAHWHTPVARLSLARYPPSVPVRTQVPMVEGPVREPAAYR